jgi:hypothetical protein
VAGTSDDLTNTHKRCNSLRNLQGRDSTCGRSAVPCADPHSIGRGGQDALRARLRRAGNSDANPKDFGPYGDQPPVTFSRGERQRITHRRIQ